MRRLTMTHLPCKFLMSVLLGAAILVIFLLMNCDDEVKLLRGDVEVGQITRRFDLQAETVHEQAP
jgi:hypothetical protein